MHWRRKWQPTPVFLPGESQGRGSLVGCYLWGHTESDKIGRASCRERANKPRWPGQALSPQGLLLFLAPCFVNNDYVTAEITYSTVVLSWSPATLWTKCIYAASAKSLQSCPTLCDPIDSSPPGCPVPGILQARTLEWAAIAFSDLYMSCI